MGARAAILGLGTVLVLAGCASAPSAPPATADPATPSPTVRATARPTPSPTPGPAPTAEPWDLRDAKVTHPGVAQLGVPFHVVVTVTNTGTEPNPLTIVSLNGLEAVADIAGCEPACKISGMEASFGGIRPGKPVKLEVGLVATALGRADYNVCVYATERSDDQVGCVSGLALVVTR